jgi:nucleoside-triphosphatase THEP1
VIYILTGPVHSGKTTLLQQVTTKFRDENIAVHGFLSLAIQENEEFIGYDLYDLKLRIQKPFIRTKGEKHWQRIGAYFFIPETLKQAQNIILQSEKADICCVDEVDPLEMEGKGVWPALKKAIILPSPDYILFVRATILKGWVEILGHSRLKIFEISDKELYTKMIQYLRKKNELDEDLSNHEKHI